MALSFKNIRIFILLIILVAVAGETWLGGIRTTDWNTSLWVVIYPVNGDGSEISQRNIDALTVDDFMEIEAFYSNAAKSYGLSIDQPFRLQLAPQIKQRPPATPEPNANPLVIAFWSLKMRWWAWRHDNYEGPLPDIQLFAEYYTSQNETGYLSFGLEKARIAVARIYASRNSRKQNNVIIAHELLHTVGASDKYDLSSLFPVHPIGYTEPDKVPLHPQTTCELMAGRIAINASEAVIPKSLRRCKIGELTAREINWLN